MCPVPLSTLNAHTHRAHTWVSPAHIHAHAYLLQMLKETLPARTADADDLHCKGQVTKEKSVSWEVNIPSGTVGKEREREREQG